MAEIDEKLHALPETFSYAEARLAGLSDRRLQRLQEEGAIERFARGLYKQGDVLENLDLLELIHRAPNATLCLTSALAHHDLTDEIPAFVEAALPREQRQPAVTAPIRWHRFETKTFELGREQATFGSLTVWIYGPERSICDAFRLRHIQTYEDANEALKRWLRRRGASPGVLIKMARHFGPPAETPIREALQVLL